MGRRVRRVRAAGAWNASDEPAKVEQDAIIPRQSGRSRCDDRMALDAIKRIRILLERGEGDFKIGHIRSADVAKAQTRVFAGW